MSARDLPTTEETKVLYSIQEAALNLIRATQLEIAGNRDGSLLPNRWTEDGFYIWQAPDAVTSLANEIHQAVKNLRERATEEEREDDHFGLCPVCHKSDGYLNIGKTHMGVCHAHKKAWPVGMNLFSSWEHETEEDWKRNAKTLVEYEEVEGFTYPRPEPERGAGDNIHGLPF